MANEIYVDIDTEFEGETRFIERPLFVTTARPFTEEELRAFVASGEHAGLD